MPGGRIHIGISGWQYDGWRGEFYPETLPRKQELAYASRLLNSIEINGTFYSLKRPDIFQAWRSAVPPDCVFAVKGSRYITHTLRLKDVTEPLANFFANGLLKLEKQLGPILWQLPPNMSWEPDAFARFCEMLPGNEREAAKLALYHDQRVEGRSWFATDSTRQLRHTFEIRDPRMMNDQMVRILRDHGHALAFTDSAGRYPYAEEITAGFVYIRLHGAEELYASGYSDAQLEWWRARIQRWAGGKQPADGPRLTDLQPPPRKSRDVYAYFDNDVKVHAPFDAMKLARMLHVRRTAKDITLPDGKMYPPPPRLARVGK